MILDEYSVENMVKAWNPPERPHCSDCTNAIVSGDLDEPIVRCRRGYGKPLPLVALIRRRFPRQFTRAADCQDFESMS